MQADEDDALWARRPGGVLQRVPQGPAQGHGIGDQRRPRLDAQAHHTGVRQRRLVGHAGDKIRWIHRHGQQTGVDDLLGEVGELL